MRVLVTGGTGFVGRGLVAALRAAGDQVIVASRNPGALVRVFGETVEAVANDRGSLPAACSRVQAVVNLAGENLFARRWRAAQKARIRESRVEGTRHLVEAIAAASPRPAVLVSASAIGVYGPRADEPLDEQATAGSDFLASVCVAWEAEAQKAAAAGVRVVCPRLGVVLGRGGGALAQMATPFKLFAGGPVGNGRQWLSWIHRDDLCALIRHLIALPELSGPVNATAPDPRTNRDFSKALGRALGRPSWLPVPGFALRVLLGEVAGLLTTGQRVLPARAQAAGFAFTHGDLDAALAQIYARTP